MGGSLAQLIASRGTMRVLRSLTTHDRPSAPSVSAVEQANSRDATIPHVITEESAYLTLPYVFACAFVSRNNKVTLLAWVELEKAEGEHLPIVRSASAVVCTYRTIISYHRVCYGAVVEDQTEMSYCESCEEYLGEISSWVEKHRRLGHQVIEFPLYPNVLQ